MITTVKRLAVAGLLCLAVSGCAAWESATKCLPTTPGFPLCGL
ncbi:hypothetical protein [Massilia sp. YMA4]|uniref:Lipoprotein n=1 Tax=[Empedobacter] haloabium TaxID=592317 RepID=A0ABZ1USZ4_9BURK|nr:hypothetical protein [Massilia sp. YMA4]